MSYFNYCLLVLILLMPGSVIANAEVREDIVGGIVIDRTISRFGNEFYRDFASFWRDVKGANKYTIVIVEKPIPKSGTVVYIEFRSKKLFQTYFGRRKSQTSQELAKQAIGNVVRHLAFILGQKQHPELLGDGY